MDWSTVSVGELLEGVREDWGKLRSPREFLERFSLPRDFGKWTARLKANTYYYRFNYLLLFILLSGICFLRNPINLCSLALSALATFTTNDNTAASINDILLRCIRKVHPPTALRLRAKANQAAPDGGLGGGKHYTRRKKVLILTLPRWTVVVSLLVGAAMLVHISSAWRTLAWACMLGVGTPLFHATFRSPNLKAKMSGARHEFRAMWRGYQSEMMGGTGPGSVGAGFASAHPTTQQTNGSSAYYGTGQGGGFTDYSR